MTSNQFLLNALKDARELVAHWGAYASQYFQEKHDLAGDLKTLDEVIRAGEKCMESDDAPDMSGVMFLHRWMRTRNPFLGDIEPLALLKMGKGDRLAQFIESAFHAETRGP